MHRPNAKAVARPSQLVALTQAEVQQFVCRIRLGVTVLLVPLGDAEALGHTQRQDAVALVGGGGVLVVVAQAQCRDATASRSQR